jgi:hypothetical protein
MSELFLSTDECYILVSDGSIYKELYDAMFHDFTSYPNTEILIEQERYNWMKSLLLKRKVRRLTKDRLDAVVIDKNDLYKTLHSVCERYATVYVIFLNAALSYYSYLPGTLKEYKKKWTNLKYVLLYLDIIEAGVSQAANYLRERDVFDYVYSIDSNDCKQIGATKVWTPYSILPQLKESICDKDLYFCGASKKRGGILADIARECETHEVKAEMDVVVYEDEVLLDKYSNTMRLFHPGEGINYFEQLKNVASTKCILDIVQSGQKALTVRPFEAVCYNKKILTNNPTIFEFPYYTPDYMQYFEKVDQIDWDWVKQPYTNPFKYQNDFSPIKFLEQISCRNFK